MDNILTNTGYGTAVYTDEEIIKNLVDSSVFSPNQNASTNAEYWTPLLAKSYPAEGYFSYYIGKIKGEIDMEPCTLVASKIYLTSQQSIQGFKYFLKHPEGFILVEQETFSPEKWTFTIWANCMGDVKNIGKWIRKTFPEKTVEKTKLVPINFWSYTPEGPSSRRRDIDGLEWKSISSNYNKKIRDEVKEVVTNFDYENTPGQLLLWTGPPGTGKTTAIRSLAYEWKDWCDFHYIMDVEKFFGAHADYMYGVLTQQGDNNKWKLIVLEDAGELLKPEAKMETGGAALGRFLNAVDGLIGHGLKTLILVTTNEPVKSLHEAVARQGRCAVDIKFDPMDTSEALKWLKKKGMDEDSFPEGQVSLADLYGKINGSKGAKKRSTPVGFFDVADQKLTKRPRKK